MGTEVGVMLLVRTPLLYMVFYRVHCTFAYGVTSEDNVK